MIKPLGEWTLAQVRDYCEACKDCRDCILAVEYCKHDNMGIPTDWPEKSEFNYDPESRP